MHKHWLDRPREEAFLFNPAFVSSLICDFVRSYEKAKGTACPMTLAFLAPALSLHRQSRQRLPSSTVTALYEWIQQNEDILVDLSRRVRVLMPLLREGTMFAFHQEVLRFEQGHNLTTGSKKGHFTPKFLTGVSKDMNDVISSTRFLARWFAKSGSEASILSSWGVRP